MVRALSRIPILYIDFPMNSWMISQSVQVGAIFVDNGVAEMHDLAVGFGDLRHPTISVVLAPKDTRCKRRLVWEWERRMFTMSCWAAL